MDEQAWKEAGDRISERVIPIIKLIRMGLLETSSISRFTGWVRYHQTVVSLSDSMACDAVFWEVERIADSFYKIEAILAAEEKVFLADQKRKFWDEY